MEENVDIPPDKCTCVGNRICDPCQIQEYKEAMRAIMKQPKLSGGNNLPSKDVNQWQEIAGCQMDNKYYPRAQNAAPEPSNAEKNTVYHDINQGLKNSTHQDNKNYRSDTLNASMRSGSNEESTVYLNIIQDQESRVYHHHHQNKKYYSDTWDALTEPSATERPSLHPNDVIQPQEICNSPEDKKCDTDCKDELSAKCDDHPMDSDSSRNDSSMNTKAELISGNLEHSIGSCDNKPDLNNDCSVNQELMEQANINTCADSANQNCKRIRRSTKRKRDAEDSCPVCGLTIRVSELENHFAKEIENLSKIPKNSRKIRFGETGLNDTYVQVKCNRENRLSAKVSKYAKKAVHCPVCSIRLTGSEDENNDHVLNCAEEDSFSDVNVTDREDSFEEYEFGNETRVRAISFVPGGYRALQGQSSKTKTAEDNDEDLNVDIDDTLTYGKPQYTELDVIHNLTDAREVKQLEQLRKAVLTDPNIEPNKLESRKWSNSSEKNDEESETNGSSENIDESETDNKSECTGNKDTACILGNQTQDDIVSSLKAKIKNLEEQNSSVKCLICLEPYTKPVVSTTCWHVHCEECWLMTMGVKKLCPQCNLIVFPSDLRRIYL